MCGLVGIADVAGIGDPDLRALRSAMDSIRHRGPDAGGLAALPLAAAGHRRLSVIDLEGGVQPMSTPDGRLTLVLNGEIYNHREIRAGLEARGHRFRTDSDTEVLLAAWRERGPACLDELNGMFAFAVLDRDRGEVHLVRDRLGIKPLYWRVAGGRLLFASELTAFRHLAPGALEIDPKGLDCYLALRYVIAPRTLLAGVRKLPPGHRAVWRDGRLSVTRWWSLPSHPDADADPVEAGERLRVLLEDSVRLRMIADVPIGVMLSGGLDSTIVTALVAARAGAGVKTFAIATSGGGAWDERPFARLAAERLGTDHHEMEVDPRGYVESLPRFAADMDDLVADPASILLYHVSGLARRHVTVALSGEGSDEIFAGYNYDLMEKPWRRQRGFDRLPRALARAAGAVSPAGSRLRRYADLHRLSAREFAREYRGALGRGLSPAARAALGRSRLGLGAARGDLAREAYAGSRAADVVSHCLYADCRSWLPDNLLTKADRMSMAHSLELRVPFLDHRVVTLAARLPLSMKLRREAGGFVRKALLRDVFAGDVPEEIRSRRKQGFTLNWEEILAGEGRELARDTLLSGRLDGLFRRPALERIVRDARPGDPDASHALLSLTLFGLWHERFLAPARTAAPVPVAVRA